MDDTELRVEAVRYASNAVASASGLPSDVVPLARRLYHFMTNTEPTRSNFRRAMDEIMDRDVASTENL